MELYDFCAALGEQSCSREGVQNPVPVGKEQRNLLLCRLSTVPVAVVSKSSTPFPVQALTARVTVRFPSFRGVTMSLTSNNRTI